MGNPCIEAHAPHLAARFDELVKSGMSEKEAGIKAALEEHQTIFNDLNKFKTSIGLRLTKEQREYKSPDTFAKVKELKDSYDAKIEAAKKALPEVITTSTPIEKKNTGTEIEPELTGGRKPVTLTGSTESERQKAIEQRKRETKQTPMTNDRDAISERIAAYNKLSRVQKRSAYNEVNRIKISVDRFNDTHGQQHSVRTNRSGDIEFRNNPTEKRPGGSPIKNTLKGEERSVIDGKPLMERDDATKKVFNDLLDNDVLPVARRVNGERMPEAEHEATIQDIMDGIPSERAENYLNSLEKQIKDDSFDYGNPDKNAAPVTLNDALGIIVEKGEPMKAEDVEKWLSKESELTPEEQETFDNLDNLITHYEQLHESESGTPAKVQQPAESGKRQDSGEVKPAEQPQAEVSEVKQPEKVAEVKADDGNGSNTSNKPDGFKPEANKKSLLNRAVEGESEDAVKRAIEKHGLSYETESWVTARENALNFIKEVGDEAALDAVRKSQVEDGAAAFIWAKLIDNVGERIAETTDLKEIEKLQKTESDLIDEFDRKSRSGGRFISALQEVYANSDFKYKASEQIKKYKDANNGNISADVEQRFNNLEKELDAVKVKLKEAEDAEIKAKEELAILNIQEELRREKTPQGAKNKSKQIADGIRKAKLSRPGIFSAATPASLVWDGAVEIAAKTVEAGGTVIEAVARGIDHIRKSEWYKNLTADKQKEAEDAFKQSANPSTVSEPSVDKGKVKVPHDLIRSIVESGVTDMNELVKIVKEQLDTAYPDITEREIRDAITKYGKTVNLNKEDVEVQIRKMKRVGRVISALEDIAEKKRPLKSGLQRDKLDADERALMKELKKALEELPVDAEAKDKQLKTSLDAVKSRLKNSIEDIEREIETGEKNAKAKGVEYDAEANDLKAERDRLKEIRDSIFGDKELTDEEKIARTIKAVDRAIEATNKKIRDNDIEIKSKSKLSSPELEAKRERLKTAKEQLDKLREDAGIFEARKIENAKKSVERQIENLKTRLRTGDYSKKAKAPPISNSEIIKLKAEKLRLQGEFDREQYKLELKNRSLGQKTSDVVLELWNVARVLRATGELSFVLIQGGFYTLSHPINAFKAMKAAATHLVSDKKAHEWLNKLRSQEFYPRMKASKLAITEPDAKLEAREEQFITGIVNHIWDLAVYPTKVFGQKTYDVAKTLNPIKMLERMGTTYLNMLRVQRYLAGEQMLKMQGKSFETHSKDYKNLADMVNTFSGRGSLGKYGEPASMALSVVFFSPRNWSSMLKQTVLMPRQLYKWRTEGKEISVANKMALTDYMKYVTLTGGVLLAAAAKLNDDDDEETGVSFDPTSSDFLKVKLGNTRVDPFGGRLTTVVFVARQIMNETTDAAGKKKDLGQDMKTSTGWDLLIQQFSNKLSPSASLVFKNRAKYKKEVDGKRVYVAPFEDEEYSVGGSLMKSAYPIYFDTMREIYEDQPDTVANFLTVLALFGVGVNTYKPKK